MVNGLEEFENLKDTFLNDEVVQQVIARSRTTDEHCANVIVRILTNNTRFRKDAVPEFFCRVVAEEFYPLSAKDVADLQDRYRHITALKPDGVQRSDGKREQENDSSDYEVEEIIGHNTNYDNKGFCYHVKWKLKHGQTEETWSDSENWVRKNNMSRCRALIKKYHDKIDKIKDQKVMEQQQGKKSPQKTTRERRRDNRISRTYISPRSNNKKPLFDSGSDSEDNIEHLTHTLRKSKRNSTSRANDLPTSHDQNHNKPLKRSIVDESDSDDIMCIGEFTHGIPVNNPVSVQKDQKRREYNSKNHEYDSDVLTGRGKASSTVNALKQSRRCEVKEVLDETVDGDGHWYQVKYKTNYADPCSDDDTENWVLKQDLDCHELLAEYHLRKRQTKRGPPMGKRVYHGFTEDKEEAGMATRRQSVASPAKKSSIECVAIPTKKSSVECVANAGDTENHRRPRKWRIPPPPLKKKQVDNNSPVVMKTVLKENSQEKTGISNYVPVDVFAAIGIDSPGNNMRSTGTRRSANQLTLSRFPNMFNLHRCGKTRLGNEGGFGTGRSALNSAAFDVSPAIQRLKEEAISGLTQAVSQQLEALAVLAFFHETTGDITETQCLVVFKSRASSLYELTADTLTRTEAQVYCPELVLQAESEANGDPELQVLADLWFEHFDRAHGSNQD